MICLEVISWHMTTMLRIQHCYYAKLNAIDIRRLWSFTLLIVAALVPYQK